MKAMTIEPTATLKPPAITAEEIAIVREAAGVLANYWPPMNDELKARLHDLALRWRGAVPPDLPPWAQAGERLVTTYALMYGSLEDCGGIDGWGSSEPKSVLAWLVCHFPPEDQRLCAVREALDVAQWKMPVRQSAQPPTSDEELNRSVYAEYVFGDNGPTGIRTYDAQGVVTGIVSLDTCCGKGSDDRDR